MPVPTDNGDEINPPVVPPPTPPPDPPPTPPPPVENLPLEPPLAELNGINPPLDQHILVDNNNNQVDPPPQPVHPSQNEAEPEGQNLNLDEGIFQSPLSELRAASNILIREANSTPRRRRLLPGPTLSPLTRHRVSLRPYIPRGNSSTSHIIADLTLNIIIQKHTPEEPLLPNELPALETKACTTCKLIPKVQFVFIYLFMKYKFLDSYMAKNATSCVIL